ncbi:PD40 domain-containing protein [Gemmatimonas groenlandica]|uniref:TolB protein n=1 Tax=Gemmatimonas groenlandica TaxID=2732249 RepID=A0A6M4IWG1_9BACT|nr:PD40 domain-containing protein [Gemmatimonas groenlandica]QJR36531.1 hypothetical protein HKW67_13960 [Gemmatimonas groenlandica]
MKRWPFVLTLALLAACGGADTITANAVPTAVALSPDGVRHASASFSPDGKHIAYWTPAADSTKDWVLTVANADLSAPTTMPVRANQPDMPVWHPDGTRLATVSSQYSATWDIVQVTLSTGDVKRLTSDPGIEDPNAWSGDGRTIAFVRSSPEGSIRSDILTVADGSSRPLVPGELRPHIGLPSPDGAHVAYMLGNGSAFTIWMADSVGGNRRPLTTEGLEVDVPNGWSPDGKHFLYISNRTGTSDLWIASVDGSPPRQLTRNVRNDYDGAWSPDGQSIAFLSDRGKQTDIWVIAAAGGEERRVTNTPAEEHGPLTWRGGTNEVVFNAGITTNSVWAIDLSSGKERQLTADSDRVSDWWSSPDGSQVAVVVDRGGGARELSLVPTAGGPARTLLSVSATLDRPMFSPDGSQLVYASDAGGTPGIWVIGVNGTAPRELTKGGLASQAVWSEDGTSVFYLHNRESRMQDVWKVPAAGGEATRVTRVGGLTGIMSRAGYPGTYVAGFSKQGGTYAVMRLRDDGTLLPVWTRSNSGWMVPLSRDSMVAFVEQPNGTMRGMVLSASGGGGRVVLKPNEEPSGTSIDGKFLLYHMTVNGATDLGILTLADGSVRRLTTSPEDESGSEFTPDGKTVIFARQRLVQRIQTVDVTSLLTPVKQR